MTRSFEELKSVIESRRRSFASEPFLRALAASSDVDDLRAIVPHVHFYVFAFQDMLRLAEFHIVDPQMREIAARHRAEDTGHEHWFSYDASELGCARDLVWVFSQEHAPTRDACYSLVAELSRARDDRCRLAFVLVLEAAGSVFFPRIVELVDRSDFGRPLRYFARSHQAVEAEHEIFSDEGERTIDGIGFDDAGYEAAVGLVHNCFDHFVKLAAHLEAQRAAFHL